MVNEQYEGPARELKRAAQLVFWFWTAVAAVDRLSAAIKQAEEQK
jgi:hypothetical protein